jgi:hypothetical protein
MTMKTVARVSTFALLIAGTSMLAAPGQTTSKPGQMTEAHVWVQNRGKSEAVPVELRDVNLDAPLKVQVINGDGAFARTSPVLVVETRKTWDYETLTVLPTDDMTTRLNVRGAAGWETTGIWSVTPDGVTKLLLKRSR